MSTIGSAGVRPAALQSDNKIGKRAENAYVKTAETAPSEGDSVTISGAATVDEIKRATDRELMRQLAGFMAKNQAEGDEASAPGMSSPLVIGPDALESPLGQRLGEMFSQYGIDLANVAGVDFSADATAERIVSFSTGLFETFKRQNAELEGDALIDAFEKTVRGAVDKGYGEARAILDGLEMPSDVMSLGERTMELVHEKFDSFFEGLRAEKDSAGSPGAGQVG